MNDPQPEALPSFHRPCSLTTARIEWQNATPVAGDFGDVYFSRDQGPDETRHVFLDCNELPERWQQWQASRAFVVGETGFGTGLNLLVAIQVFLQVAPPQARLHWISTELFPLTPEDLQQAHRHWPELAEAASWLQAVYPLPIAGFHRLQLHPRITLDLLLGDAGTNLAGLDGPVDAWCLDGFAPGKNPGMWTETLFQALARSSHADTRFATFTSAGAVKRGLQAVGFQVEKVRGFGRKREMLRGRFNAPVLTSTSTSTTARPTGRIAIIGAGLAGLCTAQALARRGLQADVYEAEHPGAGGSGNRQGVLYIKLAVDTNPASRFYLAGLEYSRRWLQQLDPDQQFWSATGVLQLALTPDENQRQQRFLERQQLPEALIRPVSQAEASQMAGTQTAGSGLFYPRSGWVRPGALCQHLASNLPNIRLLTSQPVTELQADEQQGWWLSTPDTRQHYDTVILACAHATRALLPESELPVKSIRGQVSQLQLDASSQPLPERVVCAGGYVSPPLDGTLCFGATFNLHSSDPELKPEDHQANLDELRQALPDLLPDNPTSPLPLAGRVGFRCTSPDYLPLLGPAPLATPDGLQQQPGLWLNLGHGSRGLASIPLGSELLVSRLMGEPAPVEQELVAALDPGRFIQRKLRKKQRHSE